MDRKQPSTTTHTSGLSPRPRLSLGVVLHDSHRLTRFIGEGGMGAVFEATHVRLPGKRFAIKVLKAMAGGSQRAFERFRREAEITTRFGHPNITDVLDFYVTDNGYPCMVMELLEGEDHLLSGSDRGAALRGGDDSRAGSAATPMRSGVSSRW